MRDAAEDATAELSQFLRQNAVLKALDVRVDAAESGYVELSAPAAQTADAQGFAAAAIAALAEAAGRCALGPGAETAELSLHVHGLGGLEGAERLIARGELLREPQGGRPLASAQADVFRVSAEGGEALLATALITLLAA